MEDEPVRLNMIEVLYEKYLSWRKERKILVQIRSNRRDLCAGDSHTQYLSFQKWEKEKKVWRMYNIISGEENAKCFSPNQLLKIPRVSQYQQLTSNHSNFMNRIRKTSSLVTLPPPHTHTELTTYIRNHYLG